MVLGIIAASGAGGLNGYFFATLGATSSDFSSTSLGLDNSGNMYSFGSGNDSLNAVKISPELNLVWQKKLQAGEGPLFNDSQGAVNPSTGQFYLAGQYSYKYISYFDSNANLQWQKEFRGSPQSYLDKIAVDGSGRLVNVGMHNDSNRFGLVHRVNTNASTSFAKTFKPGSANSRTDLASLVIPPSQNIYVVGNGGASYSAGSSGFVAKLNSSGTVQWLQVAPGYDRGFEQVAVDSSENVYSITGSNTPNILIKHSTSGTLQWKKQFSGNITRGIAVGPNDEVYLLGYSTVTKVNASGEIIWSRSVQGLNGSLSAIKVDSNDDVYVSGGSLAVAKLPGDGSLLGTFGSYGYSINSISASNSVLVVESSAFDVNSTGYSNVTDTTFSYDTTNYSYEIID
jgi:hypothetical protein